jgi:hypothetical protein
MKPEANNERVYRIACPASAGAFASVYCAFAKPPAKQGPHYVNKVESRLGGRDEGRTVEELHAIIEWLTGYDEKALQQIIADKTDFRTFFAEARLNPNAGKITGVICGYRVEEIEDPLMQKVRNTASAFVTVRSALGFRERNDCCCGMFHLDKLVDELAKGRAMEKILMA